MDTNGEVILEDNLSYMQRLLEEMRNAHNIVLPASGLGEARVWDVQAFDVPPPIDYTAWISFLDSQIRLSMGVPQLAITTSETGTYNLGVAQVDLFIDNEMAYIAQIEECINNQLLSRMVAYNFGAGAPPAQLRMRLDNIYLQRLLDGMVQQLSQGVPVRTGTGTLLVADWAKIAEDANVPVQVMQELPYEEVTRDEDVGGGEAGADVAEEVE